MSEDKREAILVRLKEVAESVFGAGHVFRNTLSIPESARPACVLLDADEEGDDSGFDRGRPAHAPVIVTMSPEIHILVSNTSESVGTALNDWRRQIVKAITTDAALVAACHHGIIRFQSFATGLSAGRGMEAQGVLAVGFQYMLRPDKL